MTTRRGKPHHRVSSSSNQREGRWTLSTKSPLLPPPQLLERRQNSMHTIILPVPSVSGRVQVGRSRFTSNRSYAYRYHWYLRFCWRFGWYHINQTFNKISTKSQSGSKPKKPSPVMIMKTCFLNATTNKKSFESSRRLWFGHSSANLVVYWINQYDPFRLFKSKSGGSDKIYLQGIGVKCVVRGTVDASGVMFQTIKGTTFLTGPSILPTLHQRN